MPTPPANVPELRLLGPDDDEAAWILWGRALRESPHAFHSQADEHPPFHAYRAVQEERRRSQAQPFIGAFLGDQLVGTVTVFRLPRRKVSHRAELHGLYVAPEARRAGTGRALVTAAIDAARELGAERLDLSVIAANEAALYLYREVGFEIWGRQPQAVRIDGHDTDELFMTLPLRSGSARP
jgi:ribosomal protein S18 acetylase RimI-like enzyme